jgi:Sigma-70, region 4
VEGAFRPVQLERSQEDYDRDVELVKRRAVLANMFDALPGYGGAAFWHAIEEPGISLEVLVKCLRTAIMNGDNPGRNRIIEIIIRRTQTTNEYWANNALKNINLQADERKALVSDLYADLCERLIRAFIDPQRSFWEENFQHCLRFERQHTYQAFMLREGRWHDGSVGVSPAATRRVPRMLMKSLDQPIHDAVGEGEAWVLDIEDKRAQQELLAVEHIDLLHLVLHLPQRLRSVVLLIFWEGRSEKDTARILGVTDRTVRNRLHEVWKILRNELAPEREGSYG